MKGINDMNETKRLSYELCLKGVWGRNRNPKFQVFDLKKTPIDSPLGLDEVSKLAEEKLAELKAKSGQWYITEDIETVRHENGFSILERTVVLGGQNRILSGIIG
jgi:hypothetical protein